MGRHHLKQPGRSAYVGVLAVAVVVLALSPSAAWALSSIPSPSASSLLYGVACVRSSDCWAVGYYTDSSSAQLNQALHWNGTTWSQSAIPQPGGRDSGGVNDLRAIACPAASDCWAVGSFKSTTGATLNEVLHWNGKKWSRFPVPNPGGKGSGATNILFAISCASRSSCSAVGVFIASSNGILNQALRWNGRRWTHPTVPNPGGASRAAFNEPQGVSCTSASDCWAAGDFETSRYFDQALHWNGHKWSHAKTPQPGGGSNLLSISCIKVGDCWATGDFTASGGAGLNQALHWNGRKWRRDKTPQPGGNASDDQSQLSGVSCDSARNCWAVGYFETALGPDQDEALRGNGSKWTLVATPNPGGTTTGDSNQLQAVSCPSTSDCWAVGNFIDSSGTSNLALHWNGHKWTAG